MCVVSLSFCSYTNSSRQAEAGVSPIWSKLKLRVAMNYWEEVASECVMSVPVT